MTFLVAGLHKDDWAIVQWYSGKPGGNFVSENRVYAYEFPHELAARRVVNRLNTYTNLHGYTFTTINKNCELQHVLPKLQALIVRSDVAT